ncbi:DNA-binding transcriptional regulator AraC [Micromonospora sp. MW-13]|uniref:helix-turn-helix transcriptional regulator n=1 Tax=Micromonospora sp. MW-13 TaxID=2094022 RepID=UPI000E43370A|nr:AraC family transcriptional regulator [Micromonospora sp. MW-13]RGC70295.1 DNA-binding transcriptional regulator AraC [Micromonospora sp. MW-13]
MVPSGQPSPAPPTDQASTRSDLATARSAPAPRTEPAARAAGIAALALGDLAPEDPEWRRPVLLDADLVVLVTRGHGTAELDFRPLPCRPGTLLRVRPGQALRCAGEQLDAVVLRWTPAALLRNPGLDADGDDVPAHRQLAGEDEDAVINEVTQLVVDLRRQPDVPAARALLRHQLTVLLLRLTLLPADPADPAPAGRRAEGATFRRLCQEVERGYQHTRRVEDYAARIGCSVRTLTRACLAVTGRSAKQVIDERVALEASRLLAATDEPIARIGRRIGFPEPTNFGRFFTREVGVSPGAFRAARGRATPAGRQQPPGRKGPAPAPHRHDREPASPQHDREQASYHNGREQPPAGRAGGARRPDAPGGSSRNSREHAAGLRERPTGPGGGRDGAAAGRIVRPRPPTDPTWPGRRA